MKTRTTPLLLVGFGIALLAGMAWAFWSAGGSGAATAATATLVAPGTPAASQTNGTVTVTWTAATAPGAGTVSYFIERRVQPGTTFVNACGTTSTARVTSLTSAETPGAGTYVWRVTAYFSSWTATDAESAALVVPNPDTTPPTGNVTAPSAAANVRGTVSVTSNSADSGSGVASAQFQRSPNGANTWTAIGAADTTSPYSVSWDTTTVLDGLYDLRVITTDNVGNAFTSPVVAGVRVDNTAPALSLALSSPTNASITATTVYFRSSVAGSFTFVATVTDTGSGTASATFPLLTATNWTTHAAQTVSTPAGGPYSSTAFSWSAGASTPSTYTITATDAAGNTTSTPITFSPDTTAPTGAVTSPAASAAVRATITVTSDSADAASGVASALFQRSPAGTNTWTNIAAADTTAPYSASFVTTGVTDGLYDLRVTTTDNVGNTFTSALTTNVRVDNTAPTGAITAPAAAAKVKGTVSITSSSADTGSGVATAQFQSSPAGAGTWGNIGAADTVSPYATSWDTTTYADGLYDLRVITTDVAGNTFTSATIANVLVDNTAPTGAITAPASSANVKGTVTVTANSADAGSGVANAQFQTSPAGTNTWTNLGAADTTSPYSASWVTTTGFPDGLYDLRVITTDTVGITFTSPTTTNVRVDNTAPTISVALASGPTGAFLNGNVVFFKANAAGNFQFVATVTDGGSGAASATFPALSATNWTTHNAETDSTPPGGPFSSSAFSWVATGAAPASYTITGTDAAGNTVTRAITFTVDSTAPTGAVTAPAAAANIRGTVSVTSNSADAGSGVASAQFQTSPAGAGTWSNIGAADTVSPYTTSWDTTTYADGLYDVRVITTDNVGNTFTSATIANVRVDNTAPTGAVTAPASSANVKGTFTVTANSADAGSGVANAQFQTSPAGTNTWTNLGAADTTSPYSVSWVTTTGFPDGLYDLRVVTTDKSGNTFTSATTTNVRVDNTAPTISVALASGPTGAFLNGTVVSFKSNAAGNFRFVATVTDGGSGAASATFPALSATNWTTHATETPTTPAGGPFTSTTFSWVATGAAPASYTITGTDAAGNTVTRAITFTADITAPTGAVTAPAASSNVSGTVSVTSSSADAGSGVASARFQRSPAGAGTWTDIATATTSPYTITWDTTTVADALYDLRVITTDNVGNTFTSATITNVRVDNTAPTGSVTAPSTNTFVNGSSVAVSGTAADAGSGVLNTQFQTSPAGAGTWSNLGSADTTSPYGVTWNTTTFADGRYDVRVVVTDKAGNATTSATVMIEVQNAAPTPTAVQLVDGGGTAGRVEQGDTIVITYSQTLRVSTLCSTWSGDFSDQALTTPGDVTVSLANGGAANDTVTVTSATCTFHLGTIDLGATGYSILGTRTFSGGTVATASTITWDESQHTLTITLGQAGGIALVGTVASSNATYTPDAAIKNGIGTAITGTLSTGTLPQF